MIIEKLKRQDLSGYKALIDDAFDGSESIQSYLKYDENNPSYEIIVAKDGDEVVGSATMYKIDLFTFSFQPTIELFNVAVRSDYRRKKIGKMIMKYVIKYAKENGYKNIHLTCLESEKDVHKFYESIGFKKADSRKYNLSI